MRMIRYRRRLRRSTNQASNAKSPGTTKAINAIGAATTFVAPDVDLDVAVEAAPLAEVPDGEAVAFELETASPEAVWLLAGEGDPDVVDAPVVIGELAPEAAPEA